MENIGNYFLWTSVYMAIFGLVYFFAIRKSANPAQCRWFIITGFLASLVFGAIGLIPFQRTAETVAYNVIVMPEFVLDASSAIDNTGKSLFYAVSTQSLILHLSIGISILLALRLLASIVFLMTRIRAGKRINKFGCNVLPVKKNVAPFSFFSFVFLPESMLEDECLKPVLIHEKAHIVKKHSLDLIFVELLTLVFWFNPIIWYMRRELRMQHEYEADRFVLQQKIEKTSYQKLLIDMSFSGLSYSITNPFNYSPLKKRIIMMNKNFQGSHAKAIFGMLAIIPLFAIAIVLQSCEHHQETELEGTEDITVDLKDDIDTIYTKAPVNPSFPGGMNAMYSFLQENLTYPEEERKAGIHGNVFISFVVKADGDITDIEVVRGVSPGLDKEALRVVGLMPDWEPGKLENGEAVNVRFNLPIRFVLD